jgi:lipopolysaccharide transport system ATP-binding protein
MGEIAIRAERLSKTYRITPPGRPRYHTLRDTLGSLLRAPWEGSRGRRPNRSSFHALTDVSFEVGIGEMVGIIGRNGAGKSTLLKILSRITEPSAGRLTIRGRVASLLEVGTGFHPELTGRENIYLSSAILGMRRIETNQRFDEIVAFAEIEEFIDTPVKQYSTGMYLRLAFAVASHLDPEILLVDEVLAVGDARFQKKCLNKMQDVGEGGRTVLLVSHNMPTMTRLCQRAILLKGGRVVKDGTAMDVANAYLESGTSTTPAREWPDPASAPATSLSRLCAVRVRGAEGQVRDLLDIRRPVRIEVEYEILEPDDFIITVLAFLNEDGVVAFSAYDVDLGATVRPTRRGHYVTTAEIPGNFLAEGTLSVTVRQFTWHPYRQRLYARDVVSFRMIDTAEGDSVRGEYTGAFPGVVRPRLAWTTRARG